MGDLLLKANKKFHQIAELPHEVAAYAQSLAPPTPPPGASTSHTATGFIHVATVDLVAAAEKKLAECLGIKHVRVFALDAELMKVWQVGRAADSTTGCVSRVRKYSNAASSLCALVLNARDVLIVPEPASEPSFNDMVDIPGGAGGLYLAAIASPWSTQPLGMVQVARSAKAAFIPSSKSLSVGRSDLKNPSELSEAGAAAAFARERETEQSAEDALLTELIAGFCRSFAGLLLHARAQQLHVDCPSEVQQAQLAFLSDHLSWLEGEQQREQATIDQQEAAAERLVSEASFMEQRILDSIQREKLGSSHSRQVTPLSTRSADPSAMHREAPALERRNSSVDRVDSPAMESTPVTPSQRISSAGSPLRLRTPQPAPVTPTERSRDLGRNSDVDEAHREMDTAPEALAGSTSEPSILILDEVSAIDEGDGDGDDGEGPDGTSEWEDDAFAALSDSHLPDVNHVVVESPEELDDDPSEPRGEGTEGGWDEIAAPDGEGASVWAGSNSAASGLISTDSAYSIDLG